MMRVASFYPVDADGQRDYQGLQKPTDGLQRPTSNGGHRRKQNPPGPHFAFGSNPHFSTLPINKSSLSSELRFKMRFLVKALALATGFRFAWGDPKAGSHPEIPRIQSGQHGDPQGGNSAAPGEEVQQRPVVCDLVRITSVSTTDHTSNEDGCKCIMDPNFENGTEGIMYEFDGTLPYGTCSHMSDDGITTLTVESATISGPNLTAHEGGTISLGQGSVFKKETNKGKNVPGGGLLRGDTGIKRRQLTEGDRTVIILYAIPLDVQIERTSAQLVNDIFGIPAGGEDPDPVNAQSQFWGCSRGKLNLIPACGTEDQGCHGSSHVTNGIMEVPIQANVAGLAYWQVGNLMRTKAQEILDSVSVSLSHFDHIMHVMPDDDSWGSTAGVASRPGKLTWFPSSHASSMGVLVHELGHNLGLTHSGYNGGQYSDHSDLMGNPSFGDDGPAICFNGAKSWELGWYADDSKSVVPSSEVGYSTELIGVGDWSAGNFTSGIHLVLLKIEDSSEALAYYVMYNRAEGPNSGVTFGKDKVTIVQGAPNQYSRYQAELGMPTGNDFPIFRKPGFNGETLDLVIKLCAMNEASTGANPDTATVMVYLENRTAWNDGSMRCPHERCFSDTDCSDGNRCTRNACDIPSGTCNEPVDISVTVCPSTCGSQNFCNPIGDIPCGEVCDDYDVCTNDSCSSEGGCLNEPIEGCSVPGALLETWLRIPGNDVSFLTENVAYKRRLPDQRESITHLGTAKRDQDYGARIRAYLVPPADGEYTFYVSSDASSKLYLSTVPERRALRSSKDGSGARKELIAFVNGWTNPREWDKCGSQRSRVIRLNGGSSYFLEAFHKAASSGEDHFAVAWKMPNESKPNDIALEHFFQHPPMPCSPGSECILQLQPAASFSKRGNRKSCVWDRCPSAVPHNPGSGCSCAETGAGRVNSCFMDGEEVTVAYFDRARMIPVADTPTKYRLEAVADDIVIGLDHRPLHLGSGSDVMAANECYDHLLRGGFKIDLAGTGYVFAEGSTVRVWGWSASMRAKVDGIQSFTEYSWATWINTTRPIPAGKTSLEVACGGYGGDCKAEIFVTSKYGA